MIRKSRGGNVAEVRKALEAGADPNKESVSCNKTSLTLAVLNDHQQVVDLVLSWPGVDVNAKDHTNRSPL